MESQELKGTAAALRASTMEPATLNASLWDINRRCVEQLIQSAQHLNNQQDGTHLVGAIKSRLIGLTPEKLDVVSHSPFLLVSLSFQQPEWWQKTCRHPASHALSPHWRRYFPKSVATRLTRSTLFLAWHAAHSEPAAATVTLGIHPLVLKLIRGLNLHTIDQIAEHHHARLVPRWEDRPLVWKHLIDASLLAPANQSDSFTLHGLQLIAGDYLGKSSSPR